MRDQSPQPSQIIFPVALQPELPDLPQMEYVEQQSESWGWLEIFVLSQVFWGVLLFIPGSQAFRIYIRAFPYAASLIALVSCARSNGTDSAAPGARWIIAVLVLLVANLLHESTWVTSGIAQVVFQLAIAAPVFWASRAWITTHRLERLLLLVFGANIASSGIGLLQVYYPDTFLPPEFSSLAYKLNPEFLGGLTYVGSEDRVIVRPPGLSDLPGGAAISGTIAALLGFALALRPHQQQLPRALYFASAAIAITVVYLTQVRSSILMILACTAVMALVRLRQGRILQSGWIAASAGTLVFGSFIWAVTLGGESLDARFRGMVDTGVFQTYQDNRGFFLEHTIRELPFEYPLGAGLGRWGMMSAYFGEPENWQHPALYAEIQVTGWLFDGGILMWLFYPAAILMTIRFSYRLAIEPGGMLADYALMTLLIQLLMAGLCLTGPPFNTQLGIIFWLVTAMLFGSARTLQTQAYLEAEAEEEWEE
jgi:hypothetical protein